MDFEWNKLHPMDSVFIIQASWISDIDRLHLIQLYQPFIGSRASSLYLTLVSEILPQHFESEELTIADLLTALDFSMVEFYEAKIKLEGIGLIQSFKQVHEETTRYCLLLQAPVKPRLFFRDALLSTLLLNQIGHRRFVGLESRFMRPNRNLEQWQEDSSNFEKAFITPLNVVQYHYQNPVANAIFIQEGEAVIPEEEQGPDWSILSTLLNSQFVSKEALTSSVKQTINRIYQYYHFSEQDLANFVIQVSDMNTKAIDERELVSLAIKTAEEQQKQETRSLTNQNTKEPSRVKTNKSAESPLQRLIQAAETMSPLEFIRSIKNQQGGFVSNNEQRTLIDLMEISHLPASVINILVHYLLVIKKNTSITKNLADAIANDWAQQSITTASQAIQAVQKRNQDQTKRKEANTKKRYGGQQRVETVPKWAREEKNTSETPLTGTKLKELNARIARLKSTQQDEG